MIVNKGNTVLYTTPKGNKEGVVEEKEWDVDQWSYKINGEWYCQSEVYACKVERSKFGKLIS